MLCDNTIPSSSSSLLGLAGQLYSPEDRHHYTRVILKKEQLWAQLEAIRTSLQQHYDQQKLKQIENMENDEQKETSPLDIIKSKTPASTISSYSSTRHSMSSFSLLFTKSVSMYQPQLDEYNSDFLSSHQIDRLSNQYNNSIQQLLKTTATSPPSPPSTLSKKSSITSAALSVNTSTGHHQQRHYLQHLPLSPPLSPPPSSICLSTCSSTSLMTPPRTSSLQSSLSPPPPIKTSPSITSPQEYHAITTTGNLPISSSLQPTITHIQKNNGMRIRSFLGQSMVLNKIIRVEPQRALRDSRFYQGRDESSGKDRAILKLCIIKASSQTKTDPLLAPFGIHFSNSSTGGESTTLDLPDSLILEALYVWMDHSHLPSLTRARHIMRDGIKLYIVFDPSVLFS